MNASNTIIALAAACFVTCSASAQVTRKPDAAPIPTQDRYAFDADRWSQLYEQGGEPTVLVLAGIARGEQAGGGIGSTLSTFDRTGDALLLKSEIERTLLLGRNVEIANLDAITDTEWRDVEILLLARERGAADLLATAVDASLVLVARLQPVSGHEATYRVTFNAIDASRGRTISTLAFDWQGGTDAREIKRYARLLTSDFLEGYERHVAGNGGAMPYTVRVLGADMRSLRKLVKEIKQVPGIESVRVLQGQKSRNASVAELRIRYAGTAFDLTGELFDAGELASGIELDSLDMTDGTIVLRAIDGPGKMEDSGPWRMLGSRDSIDSVDTAAFTKAYKASGKPRIAMLIGRSLSPWEIKQPWFAESYGSQPDAGDISADRGGSNIFITIADNITTNNEQAPPGLGGVVTPNYEPREIEQGLLDTKRLEDMLLDRLGAGGMGLRMVDAVTLRERALTEHPRLVFREAELIELLRESGLADIAILGDGRLERERGYTTIRYTLRAIQLETGEILSIAPAVVEVDDRARSEEINEILNALAAQASASLAQDLLSAWTELDSIQE